MKIGVVIPYRATPSREKLFDAVINWYKRNLPSAIIYTCNAPGEYWQPSASRNLGVADATKDNCDVIIMNDADTIPEIIPLMEAVEACRVTGMIHNPYLYCMQLSEEGTRDYIESKQKLSKCNVSKYSQLACFGVIVFTSKTWYELGGMDEKFIQWGPEDRAMEHVHTVIKGREFIHHGGKIWCLYHQEQIHDKGFNENSLKNRDLYIKYLSINDSANILKLVAAKPDELDNFKNNKVWSKHL